jgi:NTE family protein
LVYQQQSYERHAKDHEFSGTSMREHGVTGFEDTHCALDRKGWLVIPPPGAGIAAYDVYREYDRWRDEAHN